MRDLDALLAKRGRTRAEIRVITCPYFTAADLDLVKRYRDVGVDEVVLMVLGGNPDRVRRTLDQLATDILEPARAL